MPVIIKGSTRGSSASEGFRLAAHLISSANDQVVIDELRGVLARDLPAALEEMRLLAVGTRARKALYHASISPDPEDAMHMTGQRWREAVDELEARLGFPGHPRAVVQHITDGRRHVHVVWGRTHPITLKVPRDSHTYRRHEECARALETRWGMQTVVGVHTRRPRTPRPVAVTSHREQQAEERTGISASSVSTALRSAWESGASGSALVARLSQSGLLLARGRRGVVVVDAAGTPHRLARRLQLPAAEIARRLAGIDPSILPTVDEARASLRSTGITRRNPMKSRFGMSGGPRLTTPLHAQRSLTPGYWRLRGFGVIEMDDFLLITLPGGRQLEDHGDRLILQGGGEPTDDEIRELVSAAHARGWTSVRFYSGTPAFQKRARLEALRQGYQPDQVSLECEDGLPTQFAGGPMPDHVRRRLVPAHEPPPTTTPASTVESTSTTGLGSTPIPGRGGHQR